MFYFFFFLIFFYSFFLECKEEKNHSLHGCFIYTSYRDMVQEHIFFFSCLFQNRITFLFFFFVFFRAIAVFLMFLRTVVNLRIVYFSITICQFVGISNNFSISEVLRLFSFTSRIQRSYFSVSKRRI